MNILFPGRHHLLTRFQHDYLASLIEAGKENPERRVENILFAVTSANHSETRRNPLPLYLRAMALQEFSADLDAAALVFAIDDVGSLENFASYVIKRIASQSHGRFQLTPENSVVLCSTPAVIRLYERLGFEILPAELVDAGEGVYRATLPWEIVEAAAAPRATGEQMALYKEETHPATVRLWEAYGVLERVRRLFDDTLIGDDGDLTSTRDYNAYVRQMDENADAKSAETAPWIRPGRIGDIGCAVGSWIKRACAEERLRESEFYGVEVSRPLYEICTQRKENGEFANPFVFFSRRNAVLDTVFEPESMHTIHTSSLTHEIYSYVRPASGDDLTAREAACRTAGEEQLTRFIANRSRELRPGGVWINRDVVGPEDGDRRVHMELAEDDGDSEPAAPPETASAAGREILAADLARLSTAARFHRFARDFRATEGHALSFEETQRDGRRFVTLSLRDAWEFATKKDYVDNWSSEMHECFCFWSFDDWKQAAATAGLRVHPDSRVFLNPWIAANRLQGKISLFGEDGERLAPLPYPPTTMILILEKP